MRKRSALLLAREERPGALLCARASSAVTWKCSIRSGTSHSEHLRKMGILFRALQLAQGVPQSQQFRKSIVPARLLDRA
jgi:hypothetical protein